MVGSVNSTSLVSSAAKIKMCDSTQLVDENVGKPLPNGTETKEEESDKTKTDEKMEVDEGQIVSNVTDDSPKDAKTTPKAGRRKSRLSRSASSNSFSKDPEHQAPPSEEPSEKKKTDSEEEDFLGFEMDSLEPKSKARKETKARVESSEPSEGESLNKTPMKPEVSSNAEEKTPVVESSTSKKLPRSGFKKTTCDLSNPLFLKPFEYGWVRELVYRSTSDSGLKRNADIYYYTPTGKKVRSSREILEHLTGDNDLTADHFTFFKEPIGVDDASKEIIREAKPKIGNRIEDSATPPVKKLTPKVKVPAPSPKVAPKDPTKVITPKVVFRSSSNLKGKGKLDKKRKSAGPDDVDIMVESEDWSPEPTPVNANGLKRPLDSPNEKDQSPPEKKARRDSTPPRAGEKEPIVPKALALDGEPENSAAVVKEPTPASSSARATAAAALSEPNFMMNLNAGFIALLHAFQYLRVYELLRAGQVSKMWQFVASHNSLWETVRMKNSRVSNWKGFAKTLSSRSTKNLDLRKMLVPESYDEQVKMWEELCTAVREIKTLTKVDMGRCSPAAFIAMAEAAPQLESLVSMAIKGNEIDLLPLTVCKNLKELRLKTVTGNLDIKDLSCLSKMTNLTTLALTTIKNLKGIEDYLPENLVSLELGECSNLTKELATVALPKLQNLKRLRLEKGQNDCPTLLLLEAISTLPQLKQLELINFDIKPGFDKALAKCTNLRTLLIIPTYVTQSATTNHVVLGGVTKLTSTLTYFIWGLTLELLKVTDLFIGQVENQKAGKTGTTLPKKGCGDSIPILKPSSSEGELKEGGGTGGGGAGGGSQAPSQVDILALPNLQRVLSTLLPTTKIKILKVPFSATWRQTVTDA